MQLKSAAKLSTLIGLVTKHADCRMTFENSFFYTFVTYYYFSRAANSAVHGWIRPNFKLFQDFIVVLGTCKNEEDPTNLQNEGARVLTSLYINFSAAQGQLTPKSVVDFPPKFEHLVKFCPFILKIWSKKTNYRINHV